VHSKVRRVENCNKMLENVREYLCVLKIVLMSDRTNLQCILLPYYMQQSPS
jgi:hypothetical protein